MIRLLTSNNPRSAQAFIDYMASKGIEVRMMPEGEGQFTLWLLEEKHQVEVEVELEHFLNNPADRKYQAASWDMAETRKNVFSYHMPSLVDMIKAKAGPVDTHWYGVMYQCVRIATTWVSKYRIFTVAFPGRRGATISSVALVHSRHFALFYHAHCV